MHWILGSLVVVVILYLLGALAAGDRAGTVQSGLLLATYIVLRLILWVSRQISKNIRMRRCHKLQKELHTLQSALRNVRTEVLNALSYDVFHPLAEELKLVERDFSTAYSRCDAQLADREWELGLQGSVTLYALQKSAIDRMSSILAIARDPEKRKTFDDIADRRRSRQKRNENRELFKEAAAKLNLREKHVGIIEALREGLLDVQSTGSGLTYIRLALDSCTDQPLKVKIPKGTIFTPTHSSTQNMISVTESEITVSPHELVSEPIRSACINMHRDVPTETDEFVVRECDEVDDLGRLIRTNAFSNCNDNELQQFAVWTISDNPSITAMTPIVKTVNRMTHTTTRCNIHHRGAIQKMFEEAGIATQKYRLFSGT